MNKLNRFFWLVAMALFSSILTNCALGPNFHSPPPPVVSRYTEKPIPDHTVNVKARGGKTQYIHLGEDVSELWWTLFHSTNLNDLINRGIINSPSLEAAKAAVRQAQENLRAAIGAGLLPSVNAQYIDDRERFSGIGIGSDQPNSVFSVITAQVQVAYQLDVFGGIRRQIETFRAQFDYQGFLLHGAYLTLTANIANAAITEASFRGQIAMTKKIINLQKRLLEISEKQFALGAVAKSNVLAQQTLLAQTIATLPPLEKSLAQSRNALAALVGTFPSEAQLPRFELSELQLPKDLPLSLPSDLVRQRPDVQAYAALLHAASAQIGVATANLFPQFVINAAYGWEAHSPGQLFKESTNIWSRSLTVAQPIFQGGSLIAKRRAAIAAYDYAWAQYKQTVLTAFRNVADTLHALEKDAQTLRALVEAEQGAAATLSLTQKQYKFGAITYASLLLAEQQYQQISLNRIQAEAARYTDTVALFQALGGGWWNRCPIPFSRDSSLNKVVIH